MKTDKEILKELEAEVTRLENRQVTILGEYTHSSETKRGELAEEYDALHWRIKALNRRVALLKQEL